MISHKQHHVKSHMTIHNTYTYKQIYRHLMVTGFRYLLAIIRPKTCRSKITINHTNTVLPIEVKLIPMVTKTWAFSWKSSPLKMEPIRSPETSVSNHLTSRNNPEDGKIQATQCLWSACKWFSSHLRVLSLFYY